GFHGRVTASLRILNGCEEAVIAY
ncbi:unnamed protein product, partial [Cuscuta campestris]